MADGGNRAYCFLDFLHHCIVFINLAGFPAIIELSGKDVVTTALAPITQYFPIVTLGIMQTFSPIHVYEPITIGPLVDSGRFRGIIPYAYFAPLQGVRFRILASCVRCG